MDLLLATQGMGPGKENSPPVPPEANFLHLNVLRDEQEKDT